MSIPRLTIPETSFDPGAYVPVNRRSRLFVYLVKLTNYSSLFVIAAYIIGYIAIKPLMQLTSERRLELLEKYRGGLRDFYLNLIERVDHIPVVGINRNNKVVADEVCQTRKSGLSRSKTEAEDIDDDKLNQTQMVEKLKKLSLTLDECTSYHISEMPHYKYSRDSIKEFQHVTDVELFDYDKLYAGEDNKNVMAETKNGIRAIKGLYMSGQA